MNKTGILLSFTRKSVFVYFFNVKKSSAKFIKTNNQIIIFKKK